MMSWLIRIMFPKEVMRFVKLALEKNTALRKMIRIKLTVYGRVLVY